MNCLRLLEHALSATIGSMIFQRENGAPPHDTEEVKDFLNQTYSCWIGRDGKDRRTSSL